MDKQNHSLRYCTDLFNRQRYVSREIKVGNIYLGGNQPIRPQSMTTTDTMDTAGSVAQSVRMIEAGCELVRLTAPSKKEAENLGVISQELKALGYDTPLVADIHFTPNAAEIAAKLIEKVRVNPGNYADKKKFEEIDFTDASYQEELKRIEEKFTPLVQICKAHGTAMRIGTNHGSLSDRILSRFGDTPEGMVESAMEFLRICHKLDYHNLVISMKASNTLVMVQAYRLLVAVMQQEGMNYPLHLGVTEAGDGEDGRIKSAVGIGALLEDGLGDTIRVSLTEDPEFEIPVAQKLIQKFNENKNNKIVETNLEISYSPFEYNRRTTTNIHNVGGKNTPVVFADLSHKQQITPTNFYGLGYNYSIPLDKWNMQDQAADYVFLGDNALTFEIPGTLGAVFHVKTWEAAYADQKHCFPYLTAAEAQERTIPQTSVYFLEQYAESLDVELIQNHPQAVLVLKSTFDNKTQLYRYVRTQLDANHIQNPLVLQYSHEITDLEKFQLYTSSDAGNQFIDGFGDGIWIQGPQPSTQINSLSFGILQATRTRISKTEYISCPSCGRTLFDLQETTARIRNRTSHLKGIKIGIMGCIVNGPGEMADADYGYVGTGPGKIHLYKEKEVVRKNVPEQEAVDALIELIKENGDWVEPVVIS
jgi:(E)-4-hydroxy-3-methylbut-2-enyl-diphosphate synthase